MCVNLCGNRLEKNQILVWKCNVHVPLAMSVGWVVTISATYSDQCFIFHFSESRSMFTFFYPEYQTDFALLINSAIPTVRKDDVCLFMGLPSSYRSITCWSWRDFWESFILSESRNVRLRLLLWVQVFCSLFWLCASFTVKGTGLALFPPVKHQLGIVSVSINSCRRWFTPCPLAM